MKIHEQQIENRDVVMNSNKAKIKNLILIILFAIVFSFVVQDGIRLIIQKFLEIPADSIGLAQWGDTFFLRIFASLFAMAAGTFVIGTFLKEKVRLSGIIATLPATLFWIATLIFGITIVSDYGYSFENVKTMLLLPAILIILLPTVGYFSSGWGQEYFDEFQRSKSVLNIKWYHWLWIFPFYLNKVVAVPLFTLILLWRIDINSAFIESPIFALIFDFGNTISRIIVFFIFAGLIASAGHAYSLLSEEKTTAKINWKNGIIIFSHVLLFSILYILLFGQYL